MTTRLPGEPAVMPPSEMTPSNTSLPVELLMVRVWPPRCTSEPVTPIRPAIDVPVVPEMSRSAPEPLRFTPELAEMSPAPLRARTPLPTLVAPV